MRQDVRWKAGTAVSSDFASDLGTPIVVNTTRGDLSVLNSAGTVVTSIIGITGTGSLSFGTISSNGIATATITVNGAIAGDPVVLGAPAALEAGLTFSGIVTAANTVTVRLHNNAGTSVTPATATWTATVLL